MKDMYLQGGQALQNELIQDGNTQSYILLAKTVEALGFSDYKSWVGSSWLPLLFPEINK